MEMQLKKSRILMLDEIQTIIKDLNQRGKRFDNAKTNQIIFRLSCCCGLRRKEICLLEMQDLRLSGPRPVISIRKEITKGQLHKRRPRLVPLWWDKGTLTVLQNWEQRRLKQGAREHDPVVCSTKLGIEGKRIGGTAMSRRWKTAIRAIGEGRVSQISIHDGRHSFCSHALNGGRSLAEVRDAAGHASIATTCIYISAIERDVPDIFGEQEVTPVVPTVPMSDGLELF